MAMSFNKKTITEAIQEVLAENTGKLKTVTGPSGKTVAQVVTPEEEMEMKKKGAKIAPMEEENISIGHIDDEPGMLKQFAFDTADYAAKLYKLLHHYEQMEDHVDFPNWWQHKVMMAREYISKATHYLEFETMKPQIDAAVDGHSGEELAEDYEPRTKEDLVFQYLRDAWQFGALKGKDVNPDEELSTMADSLLANLPDYDTAEPKEKSAFEKRLEKLAADEKAKRDKNPGYAAPKSDAPKEKSAFEKRLEKLAADEKARREQNLKEDTLDEIKKAEFEKIKPGKELQLRGYGVVKVIENDGIVMKIKDSLDKVHTINLGQYNEKFLKEARKRGEKTVRTELDATVTKMKELAKKYKEGDKSVVPILKDLTTKKKALSAELEKIIAGIGAGQEYKGEVDESLTENKATCCGKCGRTHVKGTECKKPYLTGKDHCRVR